MKRALVLLRFSILLVFLVATNVANAGTAPGLQVGEYTQSINLYNRYASWTWKAQVSPSCPASQLVSIREYVGQGGILITTLAYKSACIEEPNGITIPTLYQRDSITTGMVRVGRSSNQATIV